MVLVRQLGGNPLRHLARSLFICFIAIACVSCAATIERVDASNSGQLAEAFTLGQASLPCTLGCVGLFSGSRRDMRALHDMGKWQDLALLVIRIGYDSDLSWYYLGRAAEGLQVYDAALIYYSQAMNSRLRCGASLLGSDLCDGFRFPLDLRNRMAFVRRQMRR